MMEDPYHIELIRDKLMKSLAGVLPDVIDELSLAVPEFIRTGDDGTRSSLLCRQGSHQGCMHRVRVGQGQHTYRYTEDHRPCE